MTEASSRDTPKMVTGLFQDSQSVERAYQAVVNRGYDKGDINVVMSDDTRRRSSPDLDAELRSKSAEGGELGGPTGGRIAMMIPVLAAVVAFPPLGLAIGGPIAVALAGAGAAGAAVGLIGLLHDWGIPEERAKEYEADIHDGGILMGVKARSDEEARYFVQQWQAIGGRLVHS